MTSTLRVWSDYGFLFLESAEMLAQLLGEACGQYSMDVSCALLIHTKCAKVPDAHRLGAIALRTNRVCIINGFDSELAVRSFYAYALKVRTVE